MSDLHDLLGLAYPWVKAAHVTFVIFWMAGLFILPRFYVYHHETTPGSAEDRAWIEREDRVRTIILTPAIIIVWILGLTLAWITDAWAQGWFIGKIGDGCRSVRLSGVAGELRQAPCRWKATARQSHPEDHERDPWRCRGGHRRSRDRKAFLTQSLRASIDLVHRQTYLDADG